MEEPIVVPEVNTEVETPSLNTGGEVNSDADFSAKDLLLVGAAVSLAVFLIGGTMFQLSNYKTVKTLKRKIEEQKTQVA